MSEPANDYRTGELLAALTVFYNVVEGLVSMGLGYADETLALFGFGVDSLVEVMSGVGVWHMIRRIRAASDSSPDLFERRALRITGTAFYLLTFGLIVTASLNIYQKHRPETTVWGIVVACISISFMWLLVHFKVKVGESLNSKAILADAACSRVCIYLSAVLLLASVGYELTGIGSLDAVGTIAISVLSFREGREAFQKSRGIACCCSGECNK